MWTALGGSRQVVCAVWRHQSLVKLKGHLMEDTWHEQVVCAVWWHQSLVKLKGHVMEDTWHEQVVCAIWWHQSLVKLKGHVMEDTWHEQVVCAIWWHQSLVKLKGHVMEDTWHEQVVRVVCKVIKYRLLTHVINIWELVCVPRQNWKKVTFITIWQWVKWFNHLLQARDFFWYCK